MAGRLLSALMRGHLGHAPHIPEERPQTLPCKNIFLAGLLSCLDDLTRQGMWLGAHGCGVSMGGWRLAGTLVPSAEGQWWLHNGRIVGLVRKVTGAASCPWKDQGLPWSSRPA